MSDLPEIIFSYDPYPTYEEKAGTIQTFNLTFNLTDYEDDPITLDWDFSELPALSVTAVDGYSVELTLQNELVTEGAGEYTVFVSIQDDVEPVGDDLIELLIIL